MKLDMTKKWSERTREERNRILFAPFPVIRYIGRGGSHAGGLKESPADVDNHIWRDVEVEEGAKLSVRDMFREWPGGSWRGTE